MVLKTKEEQYGIIMNSRVLQIRRKAKFITYLRYVDDIIDRLNGCVSIILQPKEKTHMFSTHEEFIDTQFKNHTEMLMNKQIQDKINILLKRYYLYYPCNKNICPKLTARSFLTAWTIVGFPDFVLDAKREEVTTGNSYKSDIYRLSFNLINRLKALKQTQNNENYRKFNKAMNLFSNSFSYFMNVDKIEKVNELSLQWYELGKNVERINESGMNQMDKDRSLQNVVHLRKNIESYILKIVPRFDLTMLNRYETLTNMIETNMKKAYGEIIIKELNEMTYEMSKRVLEEIKRAMLVLNPKLNTMLDEYFDIEFMIERHKHGALTFDDILSLGDFLVSIINELQAPIEVENTKSAWGVIKMKELDSINNLLSDILLFIMDEIEKIKENIMSIQTMMSVGINPLLLRE